MNFRINFCHVCHIDNTRNIHMCNSNEDIHFYVRLYDLVR